MPEEPTTPDLVELMQRLIDASNAGDIDATMNLYASDIVLEMPRTFGTYEGRAAVRGFVQDWQEAYDELEVAAEEIRDLCNGVIFTVVIQRGRPRAATGWVQVRYGAVTTWVGGLVRRATTYIDIDEGRAAAERLAEERG
jgi:ketosteroid isomerase-like protein